jgi:hypothetical protein
LLPFIAFPLCAIIAAWCARLSAWQALALFAVEVLLFLLSYVALLPAVQ